MKKKIEEHEREIRGKSEQDERDKKALERQQTRLMQKQQIITTNIATLEHQQHSSNPSIPPEITSSSSTLPPPEPEEFICPITQEMMDNPVSDNEGISYERTAIEEWLKIKNESPLTNKPLQHSDLRPNIALKSLIEAWKEDHASTTYHNDKEKQKTRKQNA